jgi:hypothetical protein
MENLLRVWNGSATSAEKATLQVQTWFPYCSFCRDSPTASTRFISLLLFIKRQPHCKSHVISLLLFLPEEPRCKYKYGFLITASAEKAILQVHTCTVYSGTATLQTHLWFLYCRGGCEISLIETHLIDQRIVGENPNARLWASLFLFKVTMDSKECPVKIFTPKWETFLSFFLSFFAAQ